MLPIASKILEKLIFKHVYNFLHSNKLLSKHQSGFRPNDSTTNQLSYLYHEFSKALNAKKDVRIAFCDISKAFDRVWIEGLLFKLSKIGIQGNLYNWFKNYLSNRFQRVFIRGKSSEWGQLHAGVPQGSVLGPLLFTIYINDLVDVVNCPIKMFADDTSLYVTVDNPDEGARSLNTNLENLRKWSIQWLVKFNPEKTKSLVISNRNLVHPPLVFDNKIVDEVTEHKHLGVIFNSKLNWNSHINSILQSIAKSLDVMQKLQYTIDRDTLESTYKAFIRSKMEYSCILFDDCYDYETTLLENCQLRAARIVTGAKRGTSHELLYRDTGWPELNVRREVAKMCYMHKIVNKKSPDYLIEILPGTVNARSGYETRNSKDIDEFKFRTEQFRKSLIPDCIRKWNDLDDDVKRNTCIQTFRENISAENNVKKWYSYGSRKVNIIHAQLRMKCSNLKHHLLNLHVIEDATCACLTGIENTIHYFMECPLYFTERQKLITDISSISDFNIDTILYGCDELTYEQNVRIVEAVHGFIKDSDRFSL